MKTLITATLLFISSIVSAQNTFSITGNIPGMPDSTEVALYTEGESYFDRIASSKIEDGHFSLTGEYSKPALSQLRFYVYKNGRRSNVCTIRMMLDFKPMTFTADTASILHSEYDVIAEKNVVFEGSEIQSQYMEFLNLTRAKEYAADSAKREHTIVWFEKRNDEESLAEYEKRENDARKVYSDCVETYINSHPNSYPTAALLAQRVKEIFTYTSEQYEAWLTMLENNPDTAHVNYMRRNMDRAKKYAAGAEYTDFEGKQTDNSMASLSSKMKDGKYTLIDFWASWCGPCRAAIPKVKAISEEFKEYLQVVSVSLDEKEENWRKAEAEENMPWPQMIITKDKYNTVTTAYAIKAIPRLVLISPNGKVLMATPTPALIKEKLATLL